MELETEPDDIEQRIRRAASFVNEGNTQAAAALRYGIHPSTLSRRLNGTESHKKSAEKQQKLLPEQERVIVDWILHEEQCGRAPSKRYVAAFATEILKAQGDPTPVGPTWIQGFISRNPEIHTKIGRRVKASLIGTTNSTKTGDFYPLVDQMRHQFPIQPANEYNMDEKGVQEGEDVQGTVVGHSADRRTHAAKSGATTPPQKPPLVYVYTPKKAQDLVNQLRVLEDRDGPVSRDIRVLLSKAARTISRYSAEIAKLRMEKEQLSMELERYAPGVRQAVGPDPNGVFHSPTAIRSAQDKREEQMRPMPSDELLGTDAFLESQPPPKKRARKNASIIREPPK